MRRRVSKLYSMSYILTMQWYVLIAPCISLLMFTSNSYTERVLEKFFEQMRSIQGKSTNMTSWTQLFSLDIIGELAFGEWFGGLEAAHDPDGLSHWIFLTITTHASLGWTWLRASSALFFPVRWVLNKFLFARAGTKITTFPLVKVLEVSNQLLTT